MGEHIQINRTYNLVVCAKCKRALTPGDGAIAHLRNTHQTSGITLQNIKDHLASLGQARDPKTIELPANGGPRQPVIPVEDGFKCRACPFITISKKIADNHWRNARHILEGRRYTQVHVQSWMSGKFSRYWTVGSKGYDPTVDIDARDEAGNDRSLSTLEQIVRAGAKRLRESNEQWRRAGQAHQGADYDNEFVKDMRWIQFTEGKDRAVIAAATRWVKAKETDGSAREAKGGDAEHTAQLMMLCDSVNREVKRCEPRIYAVPKPIRQRLHGIEDGKSNPIPFKMSDDSNTLHKYSIVCQRYLCFCWRAYKLGREEAASKLGMRFTEEQWGLLCDMNHVFREMDGGEVDGNESPGGHNSDIEGYAQSSQPGTERSPDYAELDGIMFAFLIASIKTKVGGAMYTNALLCFFAAAGIRQGGDGFQPAGLFTATVAAMLWILRLAFLEDSFQDMPLDKLNLHRLRCCGRISPMQKMANSRAAVESASVSSNI